MLKRTTLEDSFIHNGNFMYIKTYSDGKILDFHKNVDEEQA